MHSFVILARSAESGVGRLPFPVQANSLFTPSRASQTDPEDVLLSLNGLDKVPRFELR